MKNIIKGLSLALVLTFQAGGQSAQASDAKAAQDQAAAEPLIVIAIAKVTPGNEQAFAAAARSILVPTRAEAGNLVYDFHQSATDATEFATYERWETQAQLDAHMQSPHMQAFFQTVGSMFAPGYPQIKTYSKLLP